MKKMIMPVVLLIVGTGAVLSTQSFKKAESAIVSGYRIDETNPEHPCVDTGIECSTVPSSFICDDGMGNNLREFDGTSCPNLLYKQ